MDLQDFQKKHGPGALAELGRRAGLAKGYIYLLSLGFRGITLKMADRLVALEPELDVMSLMRAKEKFNRKPANHKQRRRNA